MSGIEPNFESPSEPIESNESQETESASEDVGSLADVGAPVGAKADKKESAPDTKEAKKEIEAKKEEIKNLKKKYALTVDGKSEDLELDLGNDEEVKKYLQKAKAADKRFQEAAEVRKAAMEFIEQLRKNPKRVLSDPNIGIDVKKFAEEILNEEIQEMEKSPEQREREKLQRELDELRQQAKDKEEAAKKAEFERMQADQERFLETEISSALDIGGLPKTPRTVKAMAEMMMIALENNIDLSPKDIAPIVKNTTLSEFKDIVSSLSDDQLEDFLGKEVIGRLRKKSVAKAKAVPTAAAIKPTGVQPKKDESPNKKNEKIPYRKFFGI
jgi:hypothetical protein